MVSVIIDTAQDVVSHIAALQAARVTTVIRYLTTTPRSPKLITPSEVHALGAAGIRLGLVFEVYGGADGVPDIDAPDGVADAKFCLSYAPTIGANNTSAIFFAIDFDAEDTEVISDVLPYFKNIYETIGDAFYVGVYGSGSVCSAVIADGYADLAWLSGSMGWRGSRKYLAAKPKELVLVQTTEDTRLADMDVDLNEALGDWGDFLPTTSMAA